MRDDGLELRPGCLQGLEVGHRPAQAVAALKYLFKRLACGQQLRITMVRQREEFPDFVRHPGQEFVTVLSGRVRIEFETGEIIEVGRHENLADPCCAFESS